MTTSLGQHWSTSVCLHNYLSLFLFTSLNEVIKQDVLCICQGLCLFTFLWVLCDFLPLRENEIELGCQLTVLWQRLEYLHKSPWKLCYGQGSSNHDYRQESIIPKIRSKCKCKVFYCTETTVFYSARQLALSVILFIDEPTTHYARRHCVFFYQDPMSSYALRKLLRTPIFCVSVD